MDKLPLEFIDNMVSIFGDQAKLLLDALSNDQSPVSIRYNLAKTSTIPNGEKVLWCNHANYLDKRPIFTLDPAFHGGQYYVQEASSMVLWQAMKALQLPDHPIVLDLCAAPGGKSTLVLDFLNHQGLLVANEVIKSRVHILEENLVKWGHVNSVITQNDVNDFAKLPCYFDLVLVDAPCSGEGMFRKDHDAINEWSNDHVQHCSLRQRRIVENVVDSIKEGGYLIYSTCTYNEIENIDNIVQFLDCGFEPINLQLDGNWKITQIEKNRAIGYLLMPHLQKGEGFFFAVLRKISNNDNPVMNKRVIQNRIKNRPATKLRMLSNTEDLLMRLKDEKWLKDDVVKMIHSNGTVYAFTNNLANELPVIMDALNVKYAGTRCGELQKNIFIPDHALALSHALNQKINSHELNHEEALKYLNRSLTHINAHEKSWMLAKYKGIGLGWFKNLGNRINNYFPIEKRIRIGIE